MTPATAVTDAFAPLALAGYDPTPSGLVQALGDLGEARSLLAQWQADGETVAVMQGARAHLEVARARRPRPSGWPTPLPPEECVHGYREHGRHCPVCGGDYVGAP